MVQWFIIPVNKPKKRKKGGGANDVTATPLVDELGDFFPLE